jgi:S-DNA-T family DNA segregation ATPase FtsK/SpoIIIE
MLLALVGGTTTLLGCLLARRLRARQARLHPQQAAARQHTQQARRLAAEWPLLAQTLGLGYRDQWTRQHRFPIAEFVADDQGVTATVGAIAGASLADYQRAAGYLADTWGCVGVRAEQQGPGLIRLRGLTRDPLLLPARVDLSGMAPESLDSWWLGWAEDSAPVSVRLAEVSGIVVAGLAGFGKTMLVAHLLGQLAPSPAVQFVLVDGKGGPDYDRLFLRAWLSAKDDLDQVRDVLRQVHRLMVDRQASIAQVLGVTDAWHAGPSPLWPLVVVVIDEAHTFFHERKGTSPEVKAHNALVAELSRLVEELIRKGRNVAIQVMLLTQRATGDAIPTRIRDNCQVAISFATRTMDGAVAALGEEIRQHPDASPVLLNDPAYVGVAVTSLPGRPGFHRVRTPQVDHHQVAAIIRAAARLRADPAVLLADRAPGLRVVPDTAAPGDAA